MCVSVLRVQELQWQQKNEKVVQKKKLSLIIFFKVRNMTVGREKNDARIFSKSFPSDRGLQTYLYFSVHAPGARMGLRRISTGVSCTNGQTKDSGLNSISATPRTLMDILERSSIVSSKFKTSLYVVCIMS